MIALRKAAEGDAPLLVAWRNDNAACFLSQERLTLDAHLRWWRQMYTLDPRDHLYVVTADGRPVGTAGMRIAGAKAEVGRMLLGEPKLRRCGVMSDALALMLGMYGPLRVYWLRVLESNTAAVSFYKRNGFHVVSAADGVAVMEL